MSSVARVRWLGVRLFLLGVLSEVLAIVAHYRVNNFAPGIFTWLIWLNILVAPIPILIGALLLARAGHA